MNEVNETKRAAAAALFLFRFRPRVTGHVGALHPASPCSTGGLRQQCALKSAGRPFMLAPCTPRSGLVRAHLPAKPMNSVYEREPWNGKRRKSSPRSGLVRARQPAKPMNSVYEREPWNGKRRKSSPRSGSVRARRPAKPINSVFEREPPAMLASPSINSVFHRRATPTSAPFPDLQPNCVKQKTQEFPSTSLNEC